MYKSITYKTFSGAFSFFKCIQNKSSAIEKRCVNLYINENYK